LELRGDESGELGLANAGWTVDQHRWGESNATLEQPIRGLHEPNELLNLGADVLVQDDKNITRIDQLLISQGQS